MDAIRKKKRGVRLAFKTASRPCDCASQGQSTNQPNKLGGAYGSM
jgi:hypothetical protein